MKENNCDKVGYTKHEAHEVRLSIYKKRKKKLRIYECPECNLFHLSSSIGMTYKNE